MPQKHLKGSIIASCFRNFSISLYHVNIWDCYSICTPIMSLECYGIAYALQFPVKNVVKQGGVIRPALFCIYTDKLLLHLSENVFDCFIGDVFLGALAHADNIVLAPTHRAMWNMLALCDKFASEYHVVFNAKKCSYINLCASQFFTSTSLPQFSVGSNDTEFMDSGLILGILSLQCVVTKQILLVNEMSYSVPTQQCRAFM